MAKKRDEKVYKASAIRAVLRTKGIDTPTKEVVKDVRKSYPHIKFNPKTASVDVSIQRRKLRGGTLATARKMTEQKGGPMEFLHEAKKFIAHCGDSETAIEAIKQVDSLQI